ncbi:MAG: MFS transporter, partial [Bauldia litoralis]
IGRLGYLFGNRSFLLLLAAFSICGFTTAGAVEVHFLPYAAACGFPPFESTLAYGVLGVANMVGMIVFGWWADRANPRRLLAGMFFARAASFLLFMEVAGDLPLLLIFAVVFGLLNFATLPVVATIAGRHFGVGIMGLSLGLLFGGHSLGAAAGAFAGGWLFDLFARYDWVWYLTFLLAIAAGILTLMIRPPERAMPTPVAVAA